jgi:hypothetical protein
VSRNTVNLGAQYTQPTAEGELTARVDWRRTGRTWWEPANTTSRDPVSLLDARLAYDTGSWSATLWGKNLTDDDTPLDILRYVDSRGTTAATALTTRAFAITLPRPRQVGISANYKF